MPRFLREFDELYSISDLHIGGGKGFQHRLAICVSSPS